jgi:hypothetical protein
LMGATGTLLEDSLLKLRGLVDQSVSQIRTAPEVVTPPRSVDQDPAWRFPVKGWGSLQG